MKRLLLAGLLGVASFAAAAPAHATIVACDNAPVLVECYSFSNGRWCTVWVKALDHGCINLPPLSVQGSLAR